MLIIRQRCETVSPLAPGALSLSSTTISSAFPSSPATKRPRWGNLPGRAPSAAGGLLEQVGDRCRPRHRCAGRDIRRGSRRRCRGRGRRPGSPRLRLRSSSLRNRNCGSSAEQPENQPEQDQDERWIGHGVTSSETVAGREGLAVLEVQERAAQDENTQEDEGNDAIKLIQVGQVEKEDLEADDREQPEPVYRSAPRFL